MSRISAKILLLPVVVVAGLAVWFLGSRVLGTTVTDVFGNPRAYSNRLVTVAGTVTGGASLLGCKYFTLADEQNELYVLTNGILPRTNSGERVKGTVKELFAVGGLQLIYFVEESNLNPDLTIKDPCVDIEGMTKFPDREPAGEPWPINREDSWPSQGDGYRAGAGDLRPAAGEKGRRRSPEGLQPKQLLRDEEA